MRALRTLIAVALLCLCSGLPAAEVRAAPQGPTASTARPAPGTSATIAAGDTTIVAWLQRGADSGRVVAADWQARSLAGLGPDGPGVDGAPRSAAAADGSVWVVASRNDGSTGRLWAQRWEGGWQAPIAGPRARSFDHHPALTTSANPTELWVAWIGEDVGGRDSSMLYAARWNGRGWGAAEPLPRSVGAPMAPSIAVDASGNPIVVWAASDGDDAEIWASRRIGGRWSAPEALTRNRVPDVIPSVARVGTELVVTWVVYSDAGYLPMARVGTDGGWSEPEVLSEVPGSRPLALSIDDRPAVFWRRLDDDPTGRTIVASTRQAGGWDEPTALTPSSGSPFAVAGASDGRLILAFTRPNGFLGVAESASTPTSTPLQELAAASAVLFEPGVTAAQPAPADDETVEPPAPIIPDIYTGFGDSITNGIVYDPDRRTSKGYREPLEQMLGAAFGLGFVLNAGVNGEETFDGVGRIDNVIRDQNPRVILIMEGVNDIMNAIDVQVVAFNLRRMVQRSYEEQPGIIPFLAQITPRLAPGDEGFDGPGNARIDQLNELLPEIAEEEGATIVDQNTPIDGHPELMSNHLHPSIAGYQVIAEEWFKAIRPVVTELTSRGDVDGSGRVDGLDLVQLALAFGAVFGEERYDAAADINGDGIVDGFDLSFLVDFFGQDIAQEQAP